MAGRQPPRRGMVADPSPARAGSPVSLAGHLAWSDCRPGATRPRERPVTAGFPAAGTTLRPKLHPAADCGHGTEQPRPAIVCAVAGRPASPAKSAWTGCGAGHRRGAPGRFPAAGLDIFELGDGPALRQASRTRRGRGTTCRPVDWPIGREHACRSRYCGPRRANPPRRGHPPSGLIRTGDDEVGASDWPADSLILDDRFPLPSARVPLLQVYQGQFPAGTRTGTSRGWRTFAPGRGPPPPLARPSRPGGLPGSVP